MNQIILHTDRQNFISIAKKEFNKTEFDYNYRIDTYMNGFKLRLIGKTVTKGAFIHPVLTSKISQLDNNAILVQFKYNISEIGYVMIALILLSVLFDYKNIVGLPVGITVLAAMYYPQYKKLKKEFSVFCNYFIRR